MLRAAALATQKSSDDAIDVSILSAAGSLVDFAQVKQTDFVPFDPVNKRTVATIVDATAGGGMVSVKMNGQKQLLSIQIDQEVFTSGDKDMLQDLIVAAVNEGIRKVDETMQSQLGSLAGGLKIPGLF